MFIKIITYTGKIITQVMIKIIFLLYYYIKIKYQLLTLNKKKTTEYKLLVCMIFLCFKIISQNTIDVSLFNQL